MTRTAKDRIIVETLEKPIEDLVINEEHLPNFVIDSRRYKIAKTEYIEDYLK